MKKITQNIGEFSDAGRRPNVAVEYAVMLALIIVVCINRHHRPRLQCQCDLHQRQQHHRQHRRVVWKALTP